MMKSLEASRNESKESKEEPLKQSTEFGRSIVVCLNPRCPVAERRFLRGLKLSEHADECKGYIFGIEALLETDDSAIGDAYPVDDLGRNIKKKLQRCAEFNLDSYADVLIEDFRSTVNKILDDFRLTMNKAMPGQQLVNQYLRIYSLEEVKNIIKGHGSSTELTTCLLTAHNSKNYKELAATNARLDELNTQLNHLMEDMTDVLLGYQKNAIVLRKDILKERYIHTLGQDKLNEVCYGIIKSQYLKS
jgi:hypothetical protein